MQERRRRLATLRRRLTALPSARAAARPLGPSLVPIAQTAAAAVAAYYVALALPLDDRPVFASIAAVISLGVSYRERGRRAAELIGGVVLGLAVADLILSLIGGGPLQTGLMIVLAMGAAVVLRGGELLAGEAAVSALLLASLEPSTPGFSPERMLEALVGGAVALAVASVFFPPDPRLLVGRAGQRLLGDLGWTLERIAAALADGDPARADAALGTAREIDAQVDALEDALATARETARLTPPRRAAQPQLDAYARSLPQLELAARNTRVLARHARRYSRSRLAAPDGLPAAVRELAGAVWELAAAYDEQGRAAVARERALAAAAQAREVFEREPDLALTEVVAQVRSAAADLARAAELAGRPAPGAGELPTEELLAAPPAAR